MLTINLFGPGQAQYFDRPLAGFPNQHCYLLLCYLLIHRDQPHDREALALLLWRENDSSNPRKQLRNALWRLRQALKSVNACIEDYLLITHEEISFVSKDNVWLDIKVFEESIVKYLDVPSQELTFDQIRQLEEILQLYRGNLLENIYADWCLYEREWFRKVLLTVLQKLVDYFEINKNYERALHYGQKILEYDVVRERVHRRIMVLHWQLGNRNAALLQYKKCVQILRDELDVSPTPETENLYRQLRSNQFDPAIHHRGIMAPNLDQTEQVLAKQALQRLRKLKTVIEEANYELHRLEEMFKQLSQPKD